MAFRNRIAMGVLAAIFLAAPALAVAAMVCTSCCCPQPPCQISVDCEMSVAEAACCDEAPAAVPSVAKRTVESASPLATSPERSSPVPGACQLRAAVRQGDLARLVSPLRLSVVLLI